VWSKPQHEVLHSDVWDSRFLFRSKARKLKDDKNLSFLLDKYSKESNQIKFCPYNSTKPYFNESSLSTIEYASECMTMYDIAGLLMENDLKDSEGEKYYEIIGKLLDECWTDYWGEADSEFDVEDIKIQEIDEKDVEEFCKIEGINLIGEETNEKD
jgi:hypothetical protein